MANYIRALSVSVIFVASGPLIAADSPVLSGTVLTVTDGDTVAVLLSSGRIEVRLHGIDAPERGQVGGSESRAFLRKLVERKAVDLEPVDQDRYERMVAVLYLGATNVNAEMVRAGHAWADRQYLSIADRDLCALEDGARGSRRGVWKGDVIAPWEWRERKGRRGFTDYSKATVATCLAEIPSSQARASPMRPAEGSLLMNINTATQPELESLPGIGPALAERVIAGRPYRRVVDLERVRGISARMLSSMEPLLTVSEPTRRMGEQ